MAFIELNGLDQVDFTDVEGDGNNTDPGAIRIIALTKCGYCHHAMKVLKKRGVGYGYAYIDKLPAETRGPLLRALKSHVSPAALLFPILLTDWGKFITGYDAEVWAEAGVDTGGTAES
ncbi:MAG: hypothetical protein WD492_06195 [Alkalispirochaeta sp.]